MKMRYVTATSSFAHLRLPEFARPKFKIAEKNKNLNHVFTRPPQHHTTRRRDKQTQRHVHTSLGLRGTRNLSDNLRCERRRSLRNLFLSPSANATPRKLSHKVRGGEVARMPANVPSACEGFRLLPRFHQCMQQAHHRGFTRTGRTLTGFQP